MRIDHHSRAPAVMVPIMCQEYCNCVTSARTFGHMRRPDGMTGGILMTWLPNFLTLTRLLLVIPVILLLAFGGTTAAWWALGLFLAASATDFFDGWLARRLDCASNLGLFLDADLWQRAPVAMERR